MATSIAGFNLTNGSFSVTAMTRVRPPFASRQVTTLPYCSAPPSHCDRHGDPDNSSNSSIDIRWGSAFASGGGGVQSLHFQTPISICFQQPIASCQITCSSKGRRVHPLAVPTTSVYCTVTFCYKWGLWRRSSSRRRVRVRTTTDRPTRFLHPKGNVQRLARRGGYYDGLFL